MSYGALNSTIDEKTVDLIEGLMPEKRGAARVWYGISSFVQRKPLGAIGAVLLFAFIGVALLAPQLATYDPDLNNYRARVKPPSVEHWFGTDNFGRDIYSRVIYGARISMSVGILATLLGTSIGAAAGLMSGFLGGRIDHFVQRVADVMFTIPGLVLAMAIVTMLGPSMLNVVIAISIPRIPDTNRVIRRCRPRRRLRQLAYHVATHPAQCPGAVYRHRFGRIKRCHPGRGLSQLSGYGCAPTSAFLGAHAVDRRHAVF
jgi:hypothetical protein